MKRIIITIGVAMLGFVAMAQKSDTPEPDEIHVIGKLKKLNLGDNSFATVYDKRTEILYQFSMGKFEELLVDGNEYVYRLLATCNNLDCYGVNYNLINFTATFKQNQVDRARIMKDAPILFRHPKKPSNY